MNVREALRFETLSLLRTREAYTFGLLPAALCLPFSLAVGTLLASFVNSRELAIPLDDPVGVAIDDHAGSWRVVRDSDPAAAFARQEVDAAVTRWEGGPEGRTIAHVLVANEFDQQAVGSVLRRAFLDALDDQIAAAGGVARVDRTQAKVERASAMERLRREPARLAWAAAVMIGSYLACFLIPVRTANERLSGALEGFAVTASGARVVFGSRLVVGTTFVVLLLCLPAVSAWLLAGKGLPRASASLDLVEVVGTLLFVDALLIGCGLLAGSVRVALYLGSYLVFALMGLLMVPLVVDLPFVPLAALARPGLGPQLVRVGLLGALTALVLGAISRLASGDRVLAPASVDE